MADWANTTIAAGDTAEEIDKLRQGGDGHIVAWGGVGLWRSLMRLDLIDEFIAGLTVRKQHGRHGRQMRGVHGAAVSVASAPPVVGQRASLGKEVRPATPVGCEHGCAVRVAVRKQAYD